MIGSKNEHKKSWSTKPTLEEPEVDLPTKFLCGWGSSKMKKVGMGH